MADSSYAEVNSMLRDMHLQRRPPAAQPAKPAAAAQQKPTAAAKPAAAAQQKPAAALPGRFAQRSAAQRNAAKRLNAPSAAGPSTAAPARAPSGYLNPSEEHDKRYYDPHFRKYQQAGIKEYRMAYNARVDSHFRGLEEPAAASHEPAAASRTATAALAEEAAARHTRGITAFVGGAAPPSQRAPQCQQRQQPAPPSDAAQRGRGRDSGYGSLHREV